MSLLKREQIAGMNIHYQKYSLDYFLDCQERLGMESIELWCAVQHVWIDPYTYYDVKAIRKKLDDRGLKPVVLTPENCTMQFQYAADGVFFEKSFGFFANGIRMAADLGCPIMECNSGWGYWNENRADAFVRSVEMLSRLADFAEEQGVTLCMESLRPEETQIAVTLAQTKELYDAVHHPRLKLMVDTTAMGVSGETLKDWFDVFGEEIIHMHFVDGNPYGHLVWGDGTHHLGQFLQTCKDYGYTGHFGQEITDGRYYADPLSADIRNLQNFKRYL